MGCYMFVSEQDRVTKRVVSDPEVNESFQEALKYDPSLMIEEYTGVRRRLFRKEIKTTRFQLYHESPAYDGSAYQARWQHSGSGRKEIVIAYLHGIINGVVHSTTPNNI